MIDKDRALGSDEELLERIDEFRMARDTVQYEIDQLEYEVEQNNADMIGTQVENIKENIGYLINVSCELEDYIWDNEDKIKKDIKEEIALEKV